MIRRHLSCLSPSQLRFLSPIDYSGALLFTFSFLSLVANQATAWEQIKIEVTDDAAYHVHAPGKPFSVALQVETRDRTRLFFHWVDDRGLALSEPKEIVSGEKLVVQSPGQKIGYYGLVVTPDNPKVFLPNQERGEPREYGFAVLPKRTVQDRKHNLDSQFGMTHADMNDPYVTGWIKTSTWNNRDPKQFAKRIAEVRAAGLEDLPLLMRQEWRTDDKQAITSAELDALRIRLKSYFEANRDVQYWELGLEENLKDCYKDPLYWDNLAAKVKVAREASDEAGTDMKFVYQVVSSGASESLLKFLESEAAKHFDVLAMHPYTWKRFPDPDRWLAYGLDHVFQAMSERQLELPIWFTEVGAPQHSCANGGCLTSGESAHNVSGKSRVEQVAFMIKLHVIGLSKGVEKIIWYNYIDRHDDRLDDPENYFGLRDFWGFPKPVYAAYVALHTHLDGKQPSEVRQLENNLCVYDFRGPRETCHVLWTSPATERSLSYEELSLAVRSKQISAVTGPMGNPIAMKRGDTLQVLGQPIFVTTANAE